MPVSLSISVQGLDELQDRLNGMSPKKNSAWVARALVDCALLTQKITTEEKIIRGGRFRGPKGPRGGKGKMTSAAPHPTKITSRTSRLRDSIAVNRSPLPFAIEVGSDVVYAAVHEYGAKSGAPHARPYLGPGLNDAAKSFDDIFMREWKKEMPR